MTIELIRLYVLVCELYDSRRNACFQRLSNNAQAVGITDQELLTIYFFGHLHRLFEKKAMHQFIAQYWHEFFPRLPAPRLRHQTLTGGDALIDSLPVMLARGPHAYTATVGREWADVGYCASKKLYFHGLRLHLIAQRRAGTLPLPQQLWLREASCADVRSVKEQAVAVPQPMLLGDCAYADTPAQGTQLVTPRKKAKGQALSDIERHYNRCVSRLFFLYFFQSKVSLKEKASIIGSLNLLI